MEGVESKSQSQGQDSQITPEISIISLAENVEGFQQCVKEILNLINQDGNFSEMTAEIYENKKSKLKEQITELSHMHGALADQHVHLIGEVSKNYPALIKTQHLDASDSSSPQVTQMFTTPDQMSNTHKFRTPLGFDVLSSGGGGGSYVSRIEGSESSFSLSSDSDSESFMSTNKLLISPVNDEALKAKETKGREALLKMIVTLEEEVVSLNTKVQTLTEENSKLKIKIHENESVISESNHKIETMGLELELSKEKLLTAEDEITKLKNELSSKIFEQTHWLQGQLGSTQQEIALLQDQLESEKEKTHGLQEEISLCVVDISVRNDQITELNDKLNQSMSENSALSTNLNQSKSENAALNSNLNQSMMDIERLRIEVSEKCELIHDLNKQMDALKHKYDVLMTEKDGLNAQLDTLRAEMCSRENLIEELEMRVNSLQVEHAGVLSSFDSAKEVTNELKVKVLELEKEVARQKEVMLDRAEEKREAIRQLSFSLEHYMSGYKELRQAFVGNKRHAVLTA